MLVAGGPATHRRHTPVYGRTVLTQVFVGRARWYAALPDQPVRIMVVRDPTGRRQDEAFFCTDLTLDAAAIRELSTRRWTLEVTFHAQGAAVLVSHQSHALGPRSPHGVTHRGLALLHCCSTVARSVPE